MPPIKLASDNAMNTLALCHKSVRGCFNAAVEPPFLRMLGQMAYRTTAATSNVQGAAVSYTKRAIRNNHGWMLWLEAARKAIRAFKAKLIPKRFQDQLVKGNCVLMPEMRRVVLVSLEFGRNCVTCCQPFPINVVWKVTPKMKSANTSLMYASAASDMSFGKTRLVNTSRVAS